MKSREIALELLKNYIEDEVSLMYEYSGDFDTSKKHIFKKVKKYLNKLDALDLIEEYKNMIWD